jgi:hypothetical protein
MTEYLAIVPGESIGPFTLGMSRAQIEALDVWPRLELEGSTHYPMADLPEQTLRGKAYVQPQPGINVTYDASGFCNRLEAILPYRVTPPVFTLCGRVANGMTAREAASVLAAIASDVKRVYGAIHSLAAGIRATRWEAGDEQIMSIIVLPRKEPALSPDKRA